MNSHDSSQEIEALQLCQDHKNIVQLIEFIKDRHYNYIVFELLNGGELFSRIRDCSYLTEESARPYFLQLVDAVSFMHSKKIVHRDLKPENIMFVDEDPESQLKIVDFGFARRSSSEESPSCFTLDYAAPESLTKGRTKESRDMWALGVILYTMLCGNTPFTPLNVDKERDERRYRNMLTENIRKGQFNKKCFQWEQLEPAAKDLIEKLLKVKESERLTLEQIQNHEWVIMKEDDFMSDEEDDSVTVQINNEVQRDDFDESKFNADMTITVDEDTIELPGIDEHENRDEVTSNDSSGIALSERNEGSSSLGSITEDVKSKNNEFYEENIETEAKNLPFINEADDENSAIPPQRVEKVKRAQESPFVESIPNDTNDIFDEEQQITEESTQGQQQELPPESNSKTCHNNMNESIKRSSSYLADENFHGFDYIRDFFTPDLVFFDWKHESQRFKFTPVDAKWEHVLTKTRRNRKPALKAISTSTRLTRNVARNCNLDSMFQELNEGIKKSEFIRRTRPRKSPKSVMQDKGNLKPIKNAKPQEVSGRQTRSLRSKPVLKVEVLSQEPVTSLRKRVKREIIENPPIINVKPEPVAQTNVLVTRGRGRPRKNEDCQPKQPIHEQPPVIIKPEPMSKQTVFRSYRRSERHAKAQLQNHTPLVQCEQVFKDGEHFIVSIVEEKVANTLPEVPEFESNEIYFESLPERPKRTTRKRNRLQSPEQQPPSKFVRSLRSRPNASDVKTEMVEGSVIMNVNYTEGNPIKLLQDPQSIINFQTPEVRSSMILIRRSYMKSDTANSPIAHYNQGTNAAAKMQETSLI